MTGTLRSQWKTGKRKRHDAGNRWTRSWEFDVYSPMWVSVPVQVGGGMPLAVLAPLQSWSLSQLGGSVKAGVKNCPKRSPARGIIACTCSYGELREKASVGGEAALSPLTGGREPLWFLLHPPPWASPQSSISSDRLRRSGHPCRVERWIEVHAWGLPGAGGILAASFPPPSCSIHANGNETSPKLVGSWAAAQVSVPRGPWCDPWVWRLGEQWPVWTSSRVAVCGHHCTWA